MKRFAWSSVLASLVLLLAACEPLRATGPEDGGGDGGPDAGDGGEDGGEEDGADGLVVLIDGQRVQLSNGISPELEVTVPENVVSVSVTVDGLGNESYALGYWKEASGQDLVYERWYQSEPQLCLGCDNRIAASEGSFGAIAPNNPASAVTAGKHRFAAYGYSQPNLWSQTPSNSEVTVHVHAKVSDALPTNGVIDLNLYFSGSNGWTASSAPDSPAFKAMMEGLETIYAQVGIQLGSLTYSDIDESYQIIETVMGPNSELMQMFAESAANDRAAVNLFFVEELRSGFGGVILGISGGIPGPMIHGSHKSGVAVITNPGSAGGKLDHVVAHEIGHFLGLFHTSEQALFGPQIHDPLPDTPENDTSYLMHNSGSGSTLSPWQGRVMRANPWVRQVEAE